MTDVVFERGRRGTARTTVGVTLFNYAVFLTQCLDSVAAQDIDGLNLIVVDDCSTDNSLEVATRWLSASATRFGHVVLCQHRQNRGLAAARNAVLAATDTEFVFMLDADNELFPQCVRRLQDALDRTTAAFAYGYHQLFDQAVGLSNTVAWNGDLGPCNRVDAMVILRKQALLEAGGYSAMPVMGWEDYDLWFKLARLGRWGVLVPEVVARYRVHGQSMLRTVTNANVQLLWTYLRATYPEFFTEPRVGQMFDPVQADGRALVRWNSIS